MEKKKGMRFIGQGSFLVDCLDGVYIDIPFFLAGGECCEFVATILRPPVPG